MTPYQYILEDLQREFPMNPSYGIPFLRAEDPPEKQIRTLMNQMRRAKSRKNRIETLIIAWHIGQILEVKAENPADRTKCLRTLTTHYVKASVWIYYLFEFLGLEQIARTRNLTLTMLTKIGHDNHQQLVQEATAIAGARLQEEEVVIT